eukprot:g1969.t1
MLPALLSPRDEKRVHKNLELHLGETNSWTDRGKLRTPASAKAPPLSNALDLRLQQHLVNFSEQVNKQFSTAEKKLRTLDDQQQERYDRSQDDVFYTEKTKGTTLRKSRRRKRPSPSTRVDTQKHSLSLFGSTSKSLAQQLRRVSLMAEVEALQTLRKSHFAEAEDVQVEKLLQTYNNRERFSTVNVLEPGIEVIEFRHCINELLREMEYLKENDFGTIEFGSENVGDVFFRREEQHMAIVQKNFDFLTTIAQKLQEPLKSALLLIVKVLRSHVFIEKEERDTLFADLPSIRDESESFMTLRALCKRLDHIIMSEQNEIEKLKVTKLTCSEARTQLHREHKYLQTKNAQVEKLIDFQQRKYEKEVKEIEELKQRIEKKNSQITLMKDEITIQKEKYEVVEQQHIESQAKKKKVNEGYTEAEDDLIELHQEEQKHAASIVEHEDLTSRIKSAKQLIKRQTRNTEGHQRRIEKHKEKLSKMRSDLLKRTMAVRFLEAKVGARDRVYTPRPDWEEIAQELGHLAPEFNRILKNASHDEKHLQRRTLQLKPRLFRHFTLQPQANVEGSTKKTITLYEKSVNPLQEALAVGKSNALVLMMCKKLKLYRERADQAADLYKAKRELKEAKQRLAMQQKNLKATIELLPYLDLKDDDGVLDEEDPEYFVALGAGPTVPKFLQYEGKVRNRKIKKVDLEILVQQIWHERKMQLKHPGDHHDQSLSDFFYIFLKQKFGIQSIVAEWGYNILYALEKYVWDADIELFLLCLTGAISEDVYDDQNNMLFQIQQLLKRMDQNYIRMKVAGELMMPGRIARVDILSTLKAFFPMKNPADFQKITDALLHDCKKDPLHYEKLFNQTSSGTQGAFIEEIRDQHLKEIQSAIHELHGKILDKDKAVTGRVLVLDIRDAIKEFDPDIRNEDLTAYLARGLRCEEHEIVWDIYVEHSTFWKQLQTGLIKKSNMYAQNCEISMPTLKRYKAKRILQNQTRETIIKMRAIRRKTENRKKHKSKPAEVHQKA